MEYQSAKVYVFDFHFDSDSKVAIAQEKERLDRVFENLKERLQEDTGHIAKVFLRKH